MVLVSNPLPGSFVTYVGADDFEIGYREARYLFEHLGGKGKIVVIEGTPAAPTNRERLRGYQRAFGEFPGIEVLGSAVGNYQTPDAKRGWRSCSPSTSRSMRCCPPMTAWRSAYWTR